MVNVASNETASFDLTGRWVDEELCELVFRLNDDTTGDTVIVYQFDQFDLEFLQQVIGEFLDSQPAG